MDKFNWSEKKKSDSFSFTFSSDDNLFHQQILYREIIHSQG